VLLSLLATSAHAQTPSKYKRPPDDVVRILDAPPTPRVSVSPTRDAMLLLEYQPYPSIEQLARPILRIAGLRIDPRAGSRQRTLQHTRLSVQALDGSKPREVELPEGALIGSPSWSHDGKRIAFSRDLDDGAELWVADPATGRPRAIPGVRLNDVLGTPFEWEADNRHLLARLVPAGRGPAPEPPAAPEGPSIRETTGRASQMATFQDLIQSPLDEEQFAHFAASQLARIDAETGAVTPLGKPDLILSAEPSPDGRYLLVTTLRRPFSYRVPYSYFARTTEVRDADGKRVATVADLPVSDDVPRQGVPKGPRSIRWQPLRDARLLWAEALDDGDPRKEVPHRDRLMALDAPFDGEPREVLKVEHRLSGLDWFPEADDVLLTEFDRDRRWRTTYRMDLSAPESTRKVFFDLSVNDAYGDPGDPVHVTRPDGTRTILVDDGSIYLDGQGAAPSGARPFLDRMNLESGAKERLFHSDPEAYETFVSFVGDSHRKILVNHQTKTDPPNYHTIDLDSGDRTRLTDFQDPAPQLTGLKKELLKYERPDGVPLSGTLYLPPDYKEGTRLPAIIWAYPLEYSDPDTAGQVRTSPHTFTRLSGDSPLFFVTQGYAVLYNATMPVIGDPETMNETYVEQITAAAKAAIDTLDAKGVIDPRRVGVAGHSYGAFMTANLLAHTDLFAAGIARSGAYNRTLTPFGFQSERRSFWEARDLYLKMSPFTFADRIDEPLLLIHGEADNNSGTFPIQSVRLFEAIQGHGGTARLVMLPHESHGYRARESVLHVLAEMFGWADRYIKNRSESEAASGGGGESK
jgi:dipeptidyl aminopeptidase/acylaminoacyl peptidase